MTKNFISDSYPKGLKLIQDVYQSVPWTRKKMIAGYIKNSKICISFNKNITHPLAKKYDYRESYCHAELMVLKNIKDGEGGVVYIYRESANQNKTEFKPGFARPCENCMRLLKDKGIKKVIYSTEFGYAVERIDF